MAMHHYPAFDASPSVLAVAWMRMAKVDVEAAALFFGSIANLATEGHGDPRSALVRRLANARRNGQRLSQAALLSLIFRAWNAWRTGKTVATFPTGTAKIPAVLR